MTHSGTTLKGVAGDAGCNHSWAVLAAGLALLAQAGEGFFAVDGLHLSALDVVIAAVEHFAHLAQLLEVSGHRVLDKLVGGTAGFRYPMINLRLKVGVLKMHVHLSQSRGAD